jgi:hypothetical protein
VHWNQRVCCWSTTSREVAGGGGCGAAIQCVGGGGLPKSLSFHQHVIDIDRLISAAQRWCMAAVAYVHGGVWRWRVQGGLDRLTGYGGSRLQA